MEALEMELQDWEGMERAHVLTGRKRRSDILVMTHL